MHMPSTLELRKYTKRKLTQGVSNKDSPSIPQNTAHEEAQIKSPRKELQAGEIPTPDPGNASSDGDTTQFPGKVKLTLLMVALCLAVFCQALDNTIIATAIPKITDEFDSIDDVGWYGSGYLLTTCAFQLSYGKLYTLFPVKWVFLIALGLFELGSLVCGAAPNSVALIMGRVISGIGAGGIYSGAMLIISCSVPLSKRPIYIGLTGAMYAFASVAGPLMGGAFTEYVTWRLCFYINLPIGSITAIFILIFVSSKTGSQPQSSLPFKEKLKQLDLAGLCLFVPTIVCLLLTLQLGGSKYSWGNVRIIVLLILFSILLIGFVGLQIWQQDRATVPPSILKQRTVWSCSFFIFFLAGAFLAMIYYLPLWFQGIKNDTAEESGIHNIPSILAIVVFSLLAGGLVTGLGYYAWACILSSILTAVGAGLLSTFTTTTNSSHWISYQIIFGAGVGFGLQQPLIAIQTVLPEHQIAVGTAIIIFIQALGGAIFVSVAQNIFTNQLLSNVAAQKIPINPTILLGGGATKLSNLVPSQFLSQVEFAYNKSITETFYVTVATGGLSLIGSILIPWKSVKKGANKVSQVADEP